MKNDENFQNRPKIKSLCINQPPKGLGFKPSMRILGSEFTLEQDIRAIGLHYDIEMNQQFCQHFVSWYVSCTSQKQK